MLYHQCLEETPNKSSLPRPLCHSGLQSAVQNKAGAHPLTHSALIECPLPNSLTFSLWCDAAAGLE